MNNYYFIYLEPEKYLAQYVLKHFGISVPHDTDSLLEEKKYIEFGNNSPEQKVIYRFLDKLPNGKMPDLPTEKSIAVKLPMKKEKHPRDGYTYLSDAAKKYLTNHLMALLDAELTKHFLESLRDMPNMNITDYMYAWCECNGIDTDDGTACETIRQKLYRFRKNWQKENSINLV